MNRSAALPLVLITTAHHRLFGNIHVGHSCTPICHPQLHTKEIKHHWSLDPSHHDCWSALFWSKDRQFVIYVSLSYYAALAPLSLCTMTHVIGYLKGKIYICTKQNHATLNLGTGKQR